MRNNASIAIIVLLQQEETRRVSDAVNSKIESDEALPERSDRECDDKEETRRVSDAANDKMESGEALPERSDRECDETEVPGATAPDVTPCRAA